MGLIKFWTTIGQVPHNLRGNHLEGTKGVSIKLAIWNFYMWWEWPLGLLQIWRIAETGFTFIFWLNFNGTYHHSPSVYCHQTVSIRDSCNVYWKHLSRSYHPIDEMLIPEKMREVARQIVELLRLKCGTMYTVALPATIFWRSL